MGRDYSKTGCLTCRQRRKKCDEAKPICARCARVNATCAYYAADHKLPPKRSVAVRRIGTFEVQQALPRSLNPVYFANHDEERVLRSIPARIFSFFSPTHHLQHRDFHALWQLMLGDELVHNALLACFSHIDGYSGEHRQLNRSAYGRSLELVRQQLTLRNLDRKDLVSLQAGIVFLGLLGSVGSAAPIDLLYHWKALAALIARGHQRNIWSSIPRSLSLMIMEATLFHLSLHAIYSTELRLAAKLWQEAKLVQTLEKLNPPGSERIGNSPILTGQYMVCGTIFEVTYLNRYPDQRRPERIAELESSIRLKASGLYQEFTARSIHPGTEEASKALYMVFQLVCDAVLICVLLLQPPSHFQRWEIDQIAITNLQRFIALPRSITHGTTVWALQILACSLRKENDFQKFCNHWEVFRTYIDPGHMGRINQLLDKISRLKAAVKLSTGVSDGESNDLPIGLSVLSEETGILSES